MSKGKFDRLQIEYRSPHELQPRSHNAIAHSKQQIRKLAKSMKRFGCVNAVLISDDNEIIAGHGRVEAAKHLGLELIPTVRLSSLTPAERLAYNLADNRLAKFARYDRNLLAVQIEELTNLGFDEIDVTGFSLGEIDICLEEAADKRGSAVAPDDELPAPRKIVVSRKGDLWILGPHRLFCGDASAAADCETLMSGQQADIVLTEGPWNLLIGHYSGYRHSDFAMTRGERSEGEIIALLSSFLRLAKESSKPGAIMFVFVDWKHLFELLTAARAQHMPLKNLIVCAKRNAGMSSFYRSQHELIAVLKNGNAAHFELGQRGCHRSNLWKYPGGSPLRAGRAEELAMHRTSKPVALLADAIRDVSDRGAIVFDPYASSGSTLIAAEKIGRRAYVLEADPAYCDIVIRRFEAYTGKTAQLDGDGLTFKDVENIRVAGSTSLEGSINKRQTE